MFRIQFTSALRQRYALFSRTVFAPGQPSRHDVRQTLSDGDSTREPRKTTHSCKAFVAAAFALLLTSVVATPTPAFAADAVTWTTSGAAQANLWYSIAYGNGLFVAVAQNGTNRVMTSPDGINWTARSAAAANSWVSVTFAKDAASSSTDVQGGLFVAVSKDGTNRAMTSPDGITWTARNTADALQWSSVTYGNGLFVAVSVTYSQPVPTTNYVNTSPDGINWTRRALPSSLYYQQWTNVTFGNGLFVAVAQTGANRVMTSSNGIDWTLQTTPNNPSNNNPYNWQSVTYGNGRFVAVTQSGAMWSTDGTTWTIGTVPNNSNHWNSVAYGSGLFVAVGWDGVGNRSMTSSDGSTWATNSTPADSNWYAVTFGKDAANPNPSVQAGLFVAVAGGGTPRVMLAAAPVVSAVTVTAGSPSSVYGSPVASVPYTVTPALAADDWFPSLTCGAYSSNDTSTALTGGEAPGSYKTICTGSATTGKGIPITYTSATYTLTKAPITLSASSMTKTYGDSVVLDTSTSWAVTAGGLVNGDTWTAQTLTVSGSPSGDQPAANVSPGSPYTITPGGAISGKALADYYSVKLETGTLTVNPAVLTIAPDKLTVPVGSDTPTYTYALTGFKNDEDSSTALSTPPTCTTSYDKGTTQPGQLSISCSGGVARYGNYSFVVAPAQLTVLPTDVLVTAKSFSRTYGDAPAVVGNDSYTVTDIPDGDTLPSNITCSTAAGQYSKPGTYSVTCTGDTLTVSTGTPTLIVYETGTYTVAKASLTVSTASSSQVYGSYVPLVITTSGWVGSDTASVSAAPTLGCGSSTRPCVGSYTVTPQLSSFQHSGNSDTASDFYDVTLNPGTLTVTPATLTVTAGNRSVVFGAAAPTAYAFTVTGTVVGEDSATALGAVVVTCTSAYTTTTPIGTQMPITCTASGSPANYTITFVAGTLTVTSPGITIQNNTTTAPVYATSSAATVTLRAGLVSGSWSPGCQVIFTLDPSAGTDSPYIVYPNVDNIANGTDVTYTATLPIGVYNIVITLGGNCQKLPGATDPSGVLVVAPSNPGSGSVGGGWYKLASGAPKQSFGYVVQMNTSHNKATGLATTTYKGNSLWTVQSTSGSTAWRLKASLTSTVVTSDTSGATVSGVPTFGTFVCPAAWGFPAPATTVGPYCGSIIAQGVLQYWDTSTAQWLPYTRLTGASGDGTVNFTITLYDGGWIKSCKNKVCQTSNLQDWYGISLRSLPGAPTIPTDVPQSTPVMLLKQGQITIWP